MQFIEVGYGNQKINNVAFIDLAAAYDTVQYNFFSRNFKIFIWDYRLLRVVEVLLRNKRFFS